MRNQNIFAPKKSHHLRNVLIVGVASFLFFLGIFMNNANTKLNENSDSNGIPINSQEIKNESNSYNEKEYGKNSQTYGEDNIKNNYKNDVVAQAMDAYYLLVETDGEIKLYYFDEDGTETFLKSTDIPFYMMSEQDQLEFREGIKIKSEDELDDLLQDFES